MFRIHGKTGTELLLYSVQMVQPVLKFLLSTYCLTLESNKTNSAAYNSVFPRARKSFLHPELEVFWLNSSNSDFFTFLLLSVFLLFFGIVFCYW
jgi:hypothetical protein